MRVIQARDSCIGPVSYTRGPDLKGLSRQSGATADTFEGAGLPRQSEATAGGIGGLLARSDWNGHAYYHPDGNGNITCLVDGSQTVVASYRYDPFGNTISSSGALSVANLYQFSSKEIHVASGMYYYGYRFYDPSLQRWINRDPVGEPSGANLYYYVRNAPVLRTDALGLNPTPGLPPGYVPPSDPGISENGLPGWVLNCGGNGPPATPMPDWHPKYQHCAESNVGAIRNMARYTVTCPCTAVKTPCLKYEQCESVQLAASATSGAWGTWEYYWVPHHHCKPCPEGCYESN